MTPNEIATSIAGLSTTDNGGVAVSMNFTYTFQDMDDSRTWD